MKPTGFGAFAAPAAWLLAIVGLAWGSGAVLALFRGGLSWAELAPEANGALLRLGRMALVVGAGLAFAVMVASRRRAVEVWLPRAVAVLAALLMVALCVLASIPLRVGPPAAPDVILVVIDTLRADYVDRERTPAILSVAEEGLGFSRAYASAPWTLPSMGSLLTGRHPREHGAGVDPKTNLGDGRRPLRGDIQTLAERFAEHGYETAALTSNPWLARGSGLERGFEHYRNLLLEDLWLPGTFEFTRRSRTASARVQTDRALWTLRLRDPSRPLFLFLHYMDPHTPWEPPRHHVRAERRVGAGTENELAYAASVRFADAELGRLFAELRRHGRWNRTVVMVTSDHGEGLEAKGDRNGHGKGFFPELVRIPLALKPADPLVVSTTCEGLVSHVDLATSLLASAGLPAQMGIGLPILDARGRCSPGRNAVFQAIPSEAPLRDGLVTQSEAVVWAHPQAWQSFDLVADPDYRQPGPASQRGAELLRAHVKEQERSTSVPTSLAARELSAEQVESLKALGYLE